MNSFGLGILFGVAFCVGGACARPAPPATVPARATSPAAVEDAMSCTVEDPGDGDGVLLVCTVPRDLSGQVRQILEGRAAAAQKAKPR
jgi:hypothetical protein